jgi:nicotinamidase/pyrazinamidase
VVKKALIVVDVQRDFCSGGALAASETHTLLGPLHACIERARRVGAVIIYTKDWHPEDHASFHPCGGPWPVHCVAKTAGAELMPPLTVMLGDIVIQKGVSVEGHGYSGFDATELETKLRQLEVAHVAVAGIATEYCVKATALDALKAGFETVVLRDMIRSVQAHDTEKHLAELNRAGAKDISADEWLEEF